MPDASGTALRIKVVSCNRSEHSRDDNRSVTLFSGSFGNVMFCIPVSWAHANPTVLFRLRRMEGWAREGRSFHNRIFFCNFSEKCYYFAAQGKSTLSADTGIFSSRTRRLQVRDSTLPLPIQNNYPWLSSVLELKIAGLGWRETFSSATPVPPFFFLIISFADSYFLNWRPV